MSLFKRLLKRSVREANTYTFIAESPWLKNDFIGEKKNMKFDFDFDKYTGNHAIHCKTEDEAEDFCQVMHEHGLMWHSGESYLGKTNWREYMEHTCYNPREGKYGPVSTYIELNYTILEWSDFMKDKKFTKADLKNGDVVMRRNGNVEIVCLETDTLIRQSGYNSLSSIDEDLTVTKDSRASHSWDIVAVRRPRGSKDCGFYAFRDNCGELIYDRERDDPEIEEMTMEDVCKALGKRVKIVDRK